MTQIPPNPVTVTIGANLASFEEAISELSKLLVDAPEGFIERLSTALDGSCDLARIDSDGASASGTNELTVTLKPSEFLNRLLATARAGDFDLSVFDHVSSSDGCVESTIEDRPPGESQSSPGGHPQPETPTLIERLCTSLAFHLIEGELTLSHAEGAIEDWRAECDQARALIKEAGFDIDVLYPILDRPTSEDPS